MSGRQGKCLKDKKRGMKAEACGLDKRRTGEFSLLFGMKKY